jgi:WD40 repeat protein
VWAVAITPDGTWLASADDASVRIWDVATGTNVANMRVAGSLRALAVSPKGSAIFNAGAFGPYRFHVDRPDSAHLTSAQTSAA